MKGSSKRWGVRGITLTELAVSIFLLGLIAYVMPMAVRLLNSIKYQQAIAQVNQQIEAFIILIHQDVNNSPEFVGAPTPTRLEMYALNTRDYSLNEDGGGAPGYPRTLNPDFFGTIVYELVPKGKDYCLRRTVTFTVTPSSTTRTESDDFLTGIVLPPAVSGHPIFSMGGDNDTIILDLGFYYPYQRRSDPPKRFVKNMLKWSNYRD